MMKLRTLKTRNLSGMQAYELEMLSLAQNIVKSLLRHNSYSKEQIFGDLRQLAQLQYAQSL
ncbi:MAG: hypothetical protein HC912_09110 [Saprospiraceae bacterium]|nr:hypothetical protein [Saprospiraceae bacterium]